MKGLKSNSNKRWAHPLKKGLKPTAPASPPKPHSPRKSAAAQGLGDSDGLGDGLDDGACGARRVSDAARAHF